MTTQQQQQKEWHLDKTLSISHIISTVAIALSAFAWAMAIEKKIEQNTQRLIFLEAVEKRLEDRVDRTRDELKQDLRAIDSKLDRLIERRHQGS